DGMSRPPPLDPGHHTLAHLVREQLGVLHTDRCRPACLVDHHDTDRYRTRQGPTTDLVHAGDQRVPSALQPPLDPQRGFARRGARSDLAVAAGTLANV